MRTAYSGRAAAYLAKGDYEKALGDQNTVVLMYAVEVEVLDQVREPDRGDVLVEAAAAYRSRSEMLRAAGKEAQAATDAKRAAKLETEGKQLAAQAAAKKPVQPEAAARTDTNLQRENTESKRRGFRIFR
jgi:tetratricopeptide (TPR) repeat protein